ncbi:MAG TPA: DUF1501 domain-containing protein [Myxococcaceae bacterium]|nr:DUF1501 domain-containing protein [Myxococcaceae bacterium]
MSRLSRRQLLRSAGALAALGAVPGFLGRALAASTPGSGKTLVLVFLRGGADGLSIVPPVGDPAYRAARPTLALAPPGKEGGAIRLDDVFALHPALAPLLPLWSDGTLGIVHAAGLPGATRSHFDAQDFCESGTPGTKSTADGWLNRAVRRATGPDGAFRVVALQPTLPRMLVGDAPAVAMSSLGQFRLPGGPGGSNAFDALYAQAVDAALRTTGLETFEALREAGSARLAQLPPANGAEYGNAPLARRLQDVARLIRSGVGLQVAATDMGGWDTHVGEGAEKGQLAARLSDLAGALAAFTRDLGPRWADTRVVVMTEFGRTARENGNRGTDHGTASVMLVLGGGVRGGRVVGGYRGLARSELFEDRDLAIGTDVRSVLWEATRAQLDLRDASTVFPGFSPGSPVLG